MAAIHEKLNVVKFLIAQGADIDAVDVVGQTALDVVEGFDPDKRTDYVDIIEFLSNAGRSNLALRTRKSKRSLCTKYIWAPVHCVLALGTGSISPIFGDSFLRDGMHAMMARFCLAQHNFVDSGPCYAKWRSQFPESLFISRLLLDDDCHVASDIKPRFNSLFWRLRLLSSCFMKSLNRSKSSTLPP
jgi:hypothetical protein